MTKTMQDLLTALKGKPQPVGYDTPAEVMRVEGNTVWVHIPGGVTETPVKRTIDCKPGETVQVRVSGGSATLTGNETTPPTGDAAAIAAATEAGLAQIRAAAASAAASAAAEAAAQARREAAEALSDAAEGISAAGQAQLAAAAAQEVADATASHFFADGDGVHIASSPADASVGENVLVTSAGFMIREGAAPRAAWSADSVEFYDAHGNPAASFGETVILQSVPDNPADPTFIVELSAESGIRLMQMLNGSTRTNVRIHGALAYMPTLQITNELQFGKTPGAAKFAWIPRSNGGLSLKWVGD